MKFKNYDYVSPCTAKTPRVEVLQVLTSMKFLNIENISTAVNGPHVISLQIISIVATEDANGLSDLDSDM